MSMPWEEVTRFVFHLVIPNKRRDCVLAEILPNGARRLPRADMPEGFRFTEGNGEGDVEKYFEDRLGIRGYLFRELQGSLNYPIRVGNVVEQHEIFLMSLLHEDSAVTKPLEWISCDDTCKSEWERTNGAEEEGYVKGLIERRFQVIKDEAEAKGAEGWDTLWWFEKLMQWTRNTLEARNMVMTDKLRKVQHSAGSFVAACKAKKRDTHADLEEERLQTQACSEVIFIKASIPMLREARRTATIRSVLGSIVPEVVAVDEREGLMMQRNGGVVTDEAFDQEALINTVLKMQELSMNRISELEAGGLEILDSEWLESNIDSILKHRLFEDYQTDKNREEVVRELRSRKERIKKGCRKITSLGLPRTIVHGDLKLRHIGSPLKGVTKVYQMFDWGRSFIGNPLHDFETLLKGTNSDFPEISIDFDAGVRQICRRWLPHVTVEEMKVLFENLWMLSAMFEVHSLSQEYDVCDDSDRKRLLTLFDELVTVAEIVI